MFDFKYFTPTKVVFGRKTEEKAETPAEEVKETKAKKPSTRKPAAKKEQQ